MKKYIVCIDFGGTYVKIALTDCNCRIIKKTMLATSMHANCKGIIDSIVFSVKDILCQIKALKKDLLGVGIGVAGPVDCRRGIVYSMTNVKGFRNVNLKAILQRRLGLPVFLDNDAKIMALGEFKRGAGRGAKNVICLTLGTGVGGAIVLNGSIYRGSKLVAGEIGHMPINKIGPRCNCGGMACLERYIGNRQITKRAVEKILKDNYKGRLMNIVKGDLGKITPKILKEAADKKDRLAIQIWSEIAEDLSVALVGLINLLNPDRIIIGGGVANADEFLFDPLRKFVNKRAMAVPVKDVKIVKAKLGDEAGIIGAAEYVKENINSKLKTRNTKQT